MQNYRKEVIIWYTDTEEDLVVEEVPDSASEEALPPGLTLVEVEEGYPGAGIPA